MGLPDSILQKLHSSQLYLVTDPEKEGGRPLLETVQRALKGGVDIVQLRDYETPDGRLLQIAIALRQVTLAYGALFIVNNRPDIARLSDADGLHLGQDDMPVAEARMILGEGKLLGVSTHSMIEARKAVADGADYIGVGPVYPTQTKKNVGTPVTLGYVREVAASKLDVPSFAIGGIKLENIEEVLRAGGMRAAIVTGIVGVPDPQKAAACFKEIIQKFPMDKD